MCCTDKWIKMTVWAASPADIHLDLHLPHQHCHKGSVLRSLYHPAIFQWYRVISLQLPISLHLVYRSADGAQEGRLWLLLSLLGRLQGHKGYRVGCTNLCQPDHHTWFWWSCGAGHWHEKVLPWCPPFLEQEAAAQRATWFFYLIHSLLLKCWKPATGGYQHRSRAVIQWACTPY